MRSLLRVWMFLLLTPLLPVIVLYVVFDRANYFRLEDTSRGILATGPIAAYVALVWLGWIIYKRVSNITVMSSAALKQVLGRWNFAASSAHGTTRRGECNITNPGGVLTIRGSFMEDDVPVGNWRSVMAQLTDSELAVVYDLTEVREGREENSKALCIVHFDPEQVSPMTGRWVVVGREGAYGTVTYTKAG